MQRHATPTHAIQPPPRDPSHAAAGAAARPVPSGGPESSLALVPAGPAERVRRLAVGCTDSVREAVLRIERGHQGIALVLDERGSLLGTITDGDVRRAMLAGISLDEPVSRVLARRAEGHYPAPVTAPIDAPRDQLLATMKDRVIRQLPLVDASGRVCDLVTLDELVPAPAPRKPEAVIMAGGRGVRLRPLTIDTPKPMLPVGGRPLLERIIGQFREAGIADIKISTNYRAEQIEGHFGDGSGHDVRIRYLCEDQPLGTAGSLTLMDEPSEPFFVMNGDILTTIDFDAMQRFHAEHDAAMTVAVREHVIEVPYGVLECEGVDIRSIREKPTHRSFVNAGIYLVSPALWREIPRGRPSNMTDLIERARENGHRVCAFPIREYWLDIGMMADYERAQADVLQFDRLADQAAGEAADRAADRAAVRAAARADVVVPAAKGARA